MKNLDIEAIKSLVHTPIENYILAGLESHMLGAKTRLFRNTRESVGIITPHSHRFDFQCLVLEGSVINSIYTEDINGDEYQVSQAEYLGQPGCYSNSVLCRAGYTAASTRYFSGDWYGMTCEQIHSISFSRDAVVMFIEGRQITKFSQFIEPVVGGEVIPTMKSEPWMFKRQPS